MPFRHAHCMLTFPIGVLALLILSLHARKNRQFKFRPVVVHDRAFDVEYDGLAGDSIKPHVPEMVDILYDQMQHIQPEIFSPR